jgi:hypothetical protein
MIDGHVENVVILYSKEKELQKLELLDELLGSVLKAGKTRLNFMTSIT